METVKDYKLYKERVLQDFDRVKRFFPFLEITILPTTLPSEITLNGYILQPEMNSIANTAVLEKYGFKINGVYPYEFPDMSVKVYDADGKICWDELPPERQHGIPGRSICTHHPAGEINAIPEQDRTIAVLLSAWQLYYQAKSYIEEGQKWVLKDLPHGEEANRILKKEGWIK
ncbi:hypothetical protein [Desulforamulus aeronauticus]|uniref:Uncharacterized protein n=1 Tax=Desulforamulus aeronauticus DSM 10349 TaxID=1121421 RepID=A0A1M6QER4_9FIRM|nr:hypothetical protein [Desulforamulus aeronauticus]SHK18759.1 hypothetical protein SAMN02745123_01006 [Desulforamulus aeronauticus DSM 10349]